MVKNRWQKLPKPKKGAWFVPVRGSYLPASLAGWLTYIPYLSYMVFAYVIGINATNSVATAALIIVPNWIAATVAMTYIAARKS